MDIHLFYAMRTVSGDIRTNHTKHRDDVYTMNMHEEHDIQRYQYGQGLSSPEGINV